MSIKFLELFPETLEFKGSSYETIESESLHPSPDSYSLSFWLYIARVQKNKQVTVINKGNTFSSNPMIALQEKTIYVKVDLNKTRSEILFSSSDLPVKKWVNIVFAAKNSEFFEASLYINGNLDSEISVNFEKTIEDSPGIQRIYIGKDPWNHGFIGSIAEPVYYFEAIDSDLITKLHQLGRKNWESQHAFKTTQHFFAQSERPQSALPDSVKPPKVLQNPSKSIMKKSDFQNQGLNTQQRLDNYFERNPSTYSKTVQLASCVDWLLIIFRALRNSLPLYRDEEGNVDNKIEVDRVIPVLHQIQLYFNRKELVEIAKILKCHVVVEYGKIPAWKEVETDDLISYIEFFEEVKRYVDSMEIGDIVLGSGDEEETTEKYGNLLSKADEWYSNRSGNFEICIDFCSNCKRHQTSTWHNENEYLQWYNDVYKELTDEFSGITIFGNKYGPPRIGSFGVYLEYLGNEKCLDQQGRLKLYKVKNSKPNIREIIDSVLVIAYLFEDTSEIGKRQNEKKREIGEKEKHSECVTGFASLNPEVKHRKNKQITEFESDTEMFCRNWGCLKKNYLYGKNHKKACNFHPGRWEFGSIHGLWPENWTCCRGEWESQGCVHGFHNGVPNKFVMKKCINRGELNAKTGRPDSVCGANFPDPLTCGKKYLSPSECRFHLGHAEPISKNFLIWTCCKVEFNPDFGDDSFCSETEHRFTEWPDQEAKIYFVTKSLSSKKKVGNFSESAKTSRFFNNDIKPYVNPYHAKKEKEALENENRHCLNWACEMVYKENENHDKACRCHTGYWDFGHSGILKGKETIVLWEPHWRCCGAKWEDPGCQLLRHSGPLVAKMEERKWKWPSEGAKRNFLKKISHLWQKKLESEHLTRKEVSHKYDQFCSEISSKVLPGNMLHRFTLILHLHILCVSEDLSFMFKYQDVISRQAENLLSDKTGYIDKDTFLEWWFAPLERIRPEMALI